MADHPTSRGDKPMITFLKTVAPFLLAFIAISLASVAMIRIGRRATPPADPFSRPFGEMPPFSPEQLRRMAPRRALYSETYETPTSVGLASRTDTGGTGPSPSGPDAARLDPMEVFEGCWRRPRA
jgi:hypothetical protein